MAVEKFPWPVQVALSKQAADALGLAAGDRFEAEDEQHRTATIVVSGVFVAGDPNDNVWAAVPELLHPVIGHSKVLTSTSTAAIVSSDSLPDLQLAVPFDDLTTRVVFSPRPSLVRWTQTERLTRAIVSLKASSARGQGEVSGQPARQRAHRQPCAGVGRAGPGVGPDRRAAGGGDVDPGAGGRPAGPSTEGIARADARAGRLVARHLHRAARRGGRHRAPRLGARGARHLVAVGDVGWRWSVPVLVAASLAGPVLATVTAARAADDRRVPANRSARQAAMRVRHVRRLLVEGTVVAVAVLTYVALRQRGVVGDGDLTASSAPTWAAIVGGLLLVRLLPPTARLVLARARRVIGAVPLVVAARTSRSVGRALPLLVVAVTVVQLTTAIALAATEQHGQAAGALQLVGGDAKWETAADRSVAAAATSVSAAPGVRAAAAARVVDGIGVSSGSSAATVRLVVVDSRAYERVLAASPLPDAPQLSRLHQRTSGKVPVLLRGGDRELREELQIRWEDTPIPLTVVGSPRRSETPRIRC